MYVQSSCDAPSDRDTYVAELMRFLEVDSYGQCLHNKDLPPHISEPVEGMFHNDFLALTGKYKFVLAMENALCDEYITEKLWRAIHVGAVPVYFGSSKAPTSKWLPNGASSAIFISDYPDPRQLSDYLKKLDENDEEYESYLQHKITGLISNDHLKEAVTRRQWGVSVDDVAAIGSFVSDYECFLCDRLHDSVKKASSGRDSKLSHYGCPEPSDIFSALRRSSKNVTSDSSNLHSQTQMWRDTYWIAKYEAQAMRKLMLSQTEFSQDHLMDVAMELYSIDRGVEVH